MSYSLMRFYAFFQLCYFCLAVNDEPGGSFKEQFPEYSGECPDLPVVHATPSKANKLIEGRWYIVQEGFTPEKAAKLSCLTWDFYLDKKEILHNFVSVVENGKSKTKNTRLTPEGDVEYTFKAELGPEFESDTVDSAFFYVGTHTFYYVEIGCKQNEKYYNNFVVGVRHLPVNDHIDFVINSTTHLLEKQTEVTYKKAKIRQTNCRHLPLKDNPYN